MNLKEIKEKVISELSKLTIDDFYTEPKLGERLLSDITEIKGRENIKKYLQNQLPKEIDKGKRNFHEKKIIELTKLKSVENRGIRSLELELNRYQKKKVLLTEKQSAIQKLKDKIKSELDELDSEISQLKPLASKVQYNKQIKLLEAQKKRKKDELEKVPIENSDLVIELKEIEGTINKTQNNIVEIENKTKSITDNILDEQNEIKQLIEDEKKLLSLYRQEENIYNFLDEILLSCYQVNNNERDGIFTYLINKNIIPENWRKIILNIFSNSVIEIEGVLVEILDGNYFSISDDFFSKSKERLLVEDISVFLATKMAVISNSSLRIEGNKLALGLSGGMMAIFAFRKKGELINKFQQKSVEVYRKQRNFQSERFSKKTLYYQTGYTNSEIQIQLPNQYYILSESYVIEIEYAPAPILFDSSNTIRINSNISGIAKKNDDIEAMDDFYRDDD